MMKNMCRNLLMKGCCLVLSFGALIPFLCRGNFYEPEEPEGLSKVLENR